MIYLGSAGREAAIEALYRSQFPGRVVKAWMRTSYDPASMLYAEQDGKICAFLQMQQRTFVLHGQKLSVCLLDLGIQSPEAPDSIMQQLIESALEIARKTSLFTAIYTRHADIFEKMGFSRLCTMKSCWISEVEDPSDSTVDVVEWSGEDLYPVYRRFMRLFDGSIVLDDRQFAAALSRQLIQGRRLYVMRSQKKIRGFALVSPKRGHPEIERVIYADLESLEALMAHVYRRYGAFWIHLSENEPLALIQEEGWKTDTSFCMIANSSEASSRFFQDQEDIFCTLERPAWNFLC